MSFRRPTGVVLIILCVCLSFLASSSLAHPASGIVVDAQGRVYLIYTRRGVMRIEPSGKLTNIHTDPGGHWMALDETGAFSRVRPAEFERITPDGAIPALIFATGGSPLTVAPDGTLYYGTDGSDSLPTGALTVARLSPRGEKKLFAPALKEKLAELHDGITGLASGPDGAIYVATWNGIIVLDRNGSIARVVHPVVVSDCDSDPADHNPANASSPFLRGLAVDSHGDVYAAATSCHRVVKITPDGQVSSILKSERPWTPTGVAVRGEEVYVLEYTNGNGPATEGWRPRIRKRARDGTWKTLVSVAPGLSPANTLP